MKLQRTEGWPDRLDAVLESARRLPYVLGESDCLRLACRAVAATTGTDFWPMFAGYRTKRQALVTIARIAPSLGEAVTLTLGVTPNSPLAVRRGDLALYRDAAGEDHLGVVAGREVLLTRDCGFASVPLADPALRCAWRVG